MRRLVDVGDRGRLDGDLTLGIGRRTRTKTVAGARVAEEEVRGRVAATRQKTGI